MKRIIVSVFVCLSFSLPLSTRASTPENFVPFEPVHFDAHELSVDAFGFYSERDKSGVDKNTFGIGVGVNYFLTDTIGFSAETYGDAFTTPYLITVSGIYRYAVPEWNLAAYGFAGGGREWEHAPQWLGHLGIGLEFRFTPNLAAFSDIRGVFPIETASHALFRFGVRFKL